jgi:hypothetical protein
MLELLFFIKPSEVEISSTNFQISVPLDGLDVVLRSFIIIKNKIEIHSPGLTLCRRLERKLIIHGTNQGLF